MSKDRWELLASLGIRQITLSLDSDCRKDGEILRGGEKGTLDALKALGKAEQAPDAYSGDADRSIRRKAITRSAPSRSPGPAHADHVGAKRRWCCGSCQVPALPSIGLG
jgi:hypothetical protein